MKIPKGTLDFGVPDASVLEAIENSSERLQNAFMYLVFNLNHVSKDVVLEECDGKEFALISHRGTKAKRLEYNVNFLLNKAFPTNDVDKGLTCKYIDDGRGHMFHLRV